MGFIDSIRKRVRSFLQIEPAQKQDITIHELMDFDTNVFRNRLWVRGDPYELEQFFKNVGNNNSMFWSSVPSRPLRKIHTGVPSMMVNVMTSIVKRDFDGIDVSQKMLEWEEIAEANNFEELLEQAINDTIIAGDGAFKFSYDSSDSKYPIIEFVTGDNIDFIYKRRKLKELVFKTVYKKDSKTFILFEHYGRGYIRYVLRDALNKDVYPLNTLEETANLQDVAIDGYTVGDDGKIIPESDLMLAVPFKIQNSSKWQGRGESLIDKKDTVFDSLDEIVSQWMYAIRKSKPKEYIPSNMTPRDKNGVPMRPNEFDDIFISIGTDMNENARNQIVLNQPVIPSENYLQSYMTMLDLCLQGFMSPSTLGIDTKKLDNAEAQREKEKTTLYTRNLIIDALQKALPKLVNVALKANEAFQGKKTSEADVDVTVNFGEYASPSFEALVEVLAKARTSNLMSIETLVDELYGDSKDDDWKKEEVQRIKEELGDSTAIVEDLNLE